MKRLSFLLLLAMSCFCADAQTKDSVPPYLKEPVIIPPFKILLADSTTFSKKDLPRKKFIVITYFNPECGHCQDEAEALSKNMAKFKKAFFVMAAYKDMDLIKEFGKRYGLDKFSNVRIGRDTQYFLPAFYAVQSTPFTAVYDKKGKFLRAFANGFTMEELEKLVK
jgi:thiol-disulfide isomerase/thioredoxin